MELKLLVLEREGARRNERSKGMSSLMDSAEIDGAVEGASDIETERESRRGNPAGEGARVLRRSRNSERCCVHRVEEVVDSRERDS